MLTEQSHTTQTFTVAPLQVSDGMRGAALLTGKFSKPEILVTFPFNAVHALTGAPLIDIFRERQDARWNREEKHWRMTGTPRHPDKFFQDAGIAIYIDQQALPGVSSLEQVYAPLSRLDENGRTVAIRHRLAGYVETTHLLGWAAYWEKGDELFHIPVTDVYRDGLPRPGVHWDQESLDASYRALTQQSAVPGFEEYGAGYGRALSMGDISKAWAADHIGTLPEWWDIELFAHQHPASFSVVLGHRLLADPPGVGKTLSAIAAAGLMRARRILITCPPLLAVGWQREFEKAGYPHPIAVFRAGRKRPELPEEGVVIAPDSMLTSKTTGAELVDQLKVWKPQVFAVDEAHRMKNLHAKRTQAILDIATAVPVRGRIPMTGTPVISGPAELVPILEFTGHLGPIFGGADAFLQRFCTRDPFGKFNARKSSLTELNMLMQQHVWVRREKDRVLPFLPKKTSLEVLLQVDTKPYRDAHNEVLEKITEWLMEFRQEWGAPPDEDAIEEYVANQLGFISMLRRASAITKIPAATDLVLEHLISDPNNDSPLICWVHHREIAFALAEALEENEVEYRLLIGGVTANQRQAAVDDYQAGEVKVLIAGLTSAGVGVTLTRGNEALFVETDWTPAIVTQAIDRQRRIGQEKPVLARTLIALNTLDERIQKVQKQKQDTAGAIHGDDQSDVALLIGDDLISPKELMRELVAVAIEKLEKTIPALTS